jgi:hypothetical protein
MKILKVKVGEVFVGDKSLPVFETYFPKTSKDGKTTYYETKKVIFVQEVADKPKPIPEKTFAGL